MSFENLHSYIFDVDASTFNTTEELPEDDCFCVEKTEEKCYLDGLMNLQPCTGLPFLVSFPHFLHASDQYNISGLKPNKDEHNSQVILEPETGTVMKIIQRYQLNYYTNPMEDAPLFHNFFEGVIPLLWIENEFTQSSNYLKLIKNKYFDDEDDDKYFDILGWSLIGVSAALVFIVFGILVYRIYYRLS